MVVVAGWVGVQFCCQILLGCCETKLLICHKGGLFNYGWGWLLYFCIDCFETKLLMYHKVGFSLFRGYGGWWGGWGGLSKKYILS